MLFILPPLPHPSLWHLPTLAIFFGFDLSTAESDSSTDPIHHHCSSFDHKAIGLFSCSLSLLPSHSVYVVYL